MRRTTIMADDALLERLRSIAHEEGVSLAEVIREGMELRAQRSRPTVTFVGIGRSGRKGHRTSERAGEMSFEPRSWR
ncbi:MAG: ribbon-helix-helix protein, CopG family [Thermoleophilia bacterium]|nr:ribbon-helix-helix protein, CopG family [Thermoleophilia bacterium]MDH4346650.1 ribbon-helix-helix protein, CopG family [Thermoleophilia bacterium]MDH5280505.1 ribbon-helix-helix protein, CopG family [Thermoleophilia bacterium]